MKILTSYHIYLLLLPWVYIWDKNPDSLSHKIKCKGAILLPYSYLKSAAVPMWMVYQFMVSVVLLRILIVMMTITYRRIYDDLDKQWK